MNALPHLSFQVFQYDGMDFHGLYDAKSNLLWYTKGLSKSTLSQLRNGKKKLEKVGGAKLDISIDCTYVGESLVLINKFS